MFPNALPLNYNNQNFLYNMVMANKKIITNEKEMFTDAVNNITPEVESTGDWYLDQMNCTGISHLESECTDGRLDGAKIRHSFGIANTEMVSCMVMVFILVCIIRYLVLKLKTAWFSNSVTEKTPLLKNKLQQASKDGVNLKSCVTDNSILTRVK